MDTFKFVFFFFQAEDGIRDLTVTGVQTCALPISLAICTALYLALGWMLTGVVNYTQLNTAAPVAMGIQATGVRWGSLVVMLGTFGGLTTTMRVRLLGQSRVFYAMPRDGLLPEWAGLVHP